MKRHSGGSAAFAALACPCCSMELPRATTAILSDSGSRPCCCSVCTINWSKSAGMIARRSAVHRSQSCSAHRYGLLPGVLFDVLMTVKRVRHRNGTSSNHRPRQNPSPVSIRLGCSSTTKREGGAIASRRDAMLTLIYIDPSVRQRPRGISRFVLSG